MRSLILSILLTAAMGFAGMTALAGEARLTEEPGSWAPFNWVSPNPTFDQIFDEILPAARAKALAALSSCDIFLEPCATFVASFAPEPVDMTQYMVCIDEDEVCFGPMFKDQVLETSVAYQDVGLTVWNETQSEFWEMVNKMIPPVPLKLSPMPLSDGITTFVASR